MVEDLLPEFWIQQRKRKKEKRPSIVYTEKHGPIHGPNLGKVHGPRALPRFRV
jgi:hypothetical protein